MRLRQFADGPLPLCEMVMLQMQDNNPLPQSTGKGLGDEQAPGWARGLRQLYGDVAQEPVPADFAELLARLDSKPAQAAPRRLKPRWM